MFGSVSPSHECFTESTRELSPPILVQIGHPGIIGGIGLEGWIRKGRSWVLSIGCNRASILQFWGPTGTLERGVVRYRGSPRPLQTMMAAGLRVSLDENRVS